MSTTPRLLPGVLPGLSILLLCSLMEEQAPIVPKETAPGSVFAFDGLLPCLLLTELLLGLLLLTLSPQIMLSWPLLMSLWLPLSQLLLTALSPALYFLPG